MLTRHKSAIECAVMDKPSSAMMQDIKLDEKFADEFPMEILIVEDNPLNQKLVKKMLQKLGYNPAVADDGEEAIKAIRSSQFQLVLMDLQMPNVDGIEATIRIFKEIPAKQQPTIIALTAAVATDVKQKCLEVGMKGFISKPIGIKELSEVLRYYYPS